MLNNSLDITFVYREVIPERVVHAKGAGAHGYFEVTKDVTKYTKAKFLDTVGKQTPVFVRFSTVGGERGSADTERDPRGFAIKFYTEEGNYDMVGNNTPVFFIRDPLEFPQFVHTQKRCPVTNMKSDKMQWDYLVKHPEAFHQLTILFSDRGTPDGYRHMNGYSSHTFKWVNEEGDAFWVKYHFKTDQGIKNFTAQEAHQMKADNPEYATQDLYEAIEKEDFPSWTLKMQFMPEAEADTYKWDITDVTKIWPHSDYPLIEIGKLVLNRNVEDYFIETEQSAFSPGHLVPGIEPSNDKLLQGRLFSYPDTHRHRLGVNYSQLQINCPYRTKVSNFQKDGLMASKIEDKKEVYLGDSNNAPKEDKKAAAKELKVTGKAGRYPYEHCDDDFEQVRGLYNNVFDEEMKQHTAENVASSLKNVNKDLQKKVLEIYAKIDQGYHDRILNAIDA